jgi:hypothetical protein
MHAVICSDADYESVAFQKFMQSERAAGYSQWIFDLIENRFHKNNEKVFIDGPAWCLCADKHNGHDARYLVVFKDKSLKTLRDLRSTHLGLLEEIQATVLAWLKRRHPQQYCMYFHYMPSVFQLHLHVNSCAQYINRHRAHFLATVMRNLRRESEHYARALILTKMCKTLKKAETHETVKVAI